MQTKLLLRNLKVFLPSSFPAGSRRRNFSLKISFKSKSNAFPKLPKFYFQSDLPSFSTSSEHKAGQVLAAIKLTLFQNQSIMKTLNRKSFIKRFLAEKKSLMFYSVHIIPITFFSWRFLSFYRIETAFSSNFIKDRFSNSLSFDSTESFLKDKICSETKNTSKINKSTLSLVLLYIFEPIFITCRFAYLVFLFLPLILSTPILLIGKKIPENDDERSGTLYWYDLLVVQMEKAGPTFIKLSQWAASRTDIFPQEMCIRLARLQSSVDPHPFSVTQKIIEAGFKLPFNVIFEEFDPKPIGIGAIAQVYKAKIRTEILPRFIQESPPTNFKYPESDSPLSTDVAIKVLHPKAESTIRRDLKILMFFAKIINFIPTMQWLSLPEEVHNFGEMMQDQLDLRIEASNLQVFLENFKNRPSVSFPRPYIEYTTKNMLIEEYEAGLPIKMFLERGGGVFQHTIADIGLKAFLNMLILDNFVHADLHPGNILITFAKPKVQSFFGRLWASIASTPILDYSNSATQQLNLSFKDQTRWEEELSRLFQDGFQPVIIFIDTGLVTTLNDENRRNFLDLFQAVAEFDGYRAGKLMIERSKMAHAVLDGEVFALKMQNLILRVKSATLALAKFRISDILTTVLQMVRNHHVKLEGDFINVAISILLLEGIGRRLDPDIDLLKSALPILRQMGVQEAGRGVVEGIRDIPTGTSLFMFWFWLEAREWVGNLSWDEMQEIFEKQIWWPDM